MHYKEFKKEKDNIYKDFKKDVEKAKIVRDQKLKILQNIFDNENRKNVVKRIKQTLNKRG